MYENMSDYAQSPYAGIEYHKSVVARMGAADVENFLRLYLTPGADHMGVGAPASVDLLDALTEWVEKGTAPGELVAVLQETKPPFGVLAARPMCRYPAYPSYRGGDVTKAGSFMCKP